MSGILEEAIEIAKRQGYNVITSGLVTTTIITDPNKYSLTHPTILKAIKEQATR